MPIVDGDKAGDGYRKKLLKCATPPPVILQLDDGLALEDAIAWLLAPSTEDHWNAIKEILPDVKAGDEASLVAALDECKTYWKAHEELLGVLSGNSESIQRLNRFCDGLCDLAITEETEQSCWREDTTHTSGKPTRHWRWTPDEES